MIRFSKWVNAHFGSGDPNEMYSTFAYREDRKKTVCIIDFVSFVFFNVVKHCRECYEYEKEENMIHLAIRHTQCDRCGQFFLISLLYNNDDEKGYQSPKTGEHYCSKRCCDLKEGDAMQTAVDFEATCSLVGEGL